MQPKLIQTAFVIAVDAFVLSVILVIASPMQRLSFYRRVTMFTKLVAITFLFVAATSCFAKDECQAKPGVKTINIPLASQSMEPVCEPERIRVNDRSPMTIVVQNLSPLEVCALTPTAPTVTAVTNPIESIINTISAYKAFDFPAATAHTAGTHPLGALFKTAGPNPDTDARDLFEKLSGQVIPLAKGIYVKQSDMQNTFKTDIMNLSNYIAADYRGKKWSDFAPDKDPNITKARQDIAFPVIQSGGTTTPATELDWAPLQALLDQLKALQPRLIVSCTTAGTECDQNILSKTSQDIEQATSILTILQDNFKSLQSSQTAIQASIAVLDSIKTDFAIRVNNSQKIQKFPKDPANIASLDPTALGVFQHTQILTQSFSLGTNYGATATGSIACSMTETAPATPTTDAMSYTVLYQNVPALTVSAGMLISFIQKNEYGVTEANAPTTTPPTVNTVFSITDSAPASVVPMAYINYRFAPPILKTWWGEPNNEMVISHNLSAGIGLNTNTGTTQPEFFAGYAIGFGRALIHAGLDYGRTESLGGGFALGVVPMGFTGTTAPIDWAFHPGFAIGISVRIAPF
jgi:hypothetical protein